MSLTGNHEAIYEFAAGQQQKTQHLGQAGRSFSCSFSMME